MVGFATILVKPALANGDEVGEYWEEYGEYDEYENEYAEAMGEIAFYLGLLLNLGFVAVRWARFVVNTPPGLQRLALELHMDGNIVLTIPALWHAYTFIDKAGPVEYAAVTLILVLTLSGIVMRYYRNRRARLIARMIHSQRILALLLLVLLLIHVAGVED
ncbi:hypothetical protein Pyrde_0346 [Pyrodictium delaneyi]|nr:hypothetical protein [Pyrodictium delaneyi]ALL00396.1 hypothetical protein Pyrde_0346 [Pyrodictium delaneyi]